MLEECPWAEEYEPAMECCFRWLDLIGVDTEAMPVEGVGSGVRVMKSWEGIVEERWRCKEEEVEGEGIGGVWIKGAVESRLGLVEPDDVGLLWWAQDELVLLDERPLSAVREDRFGEEVEAEAPYAAGVQVEGFFDIRDH